MWPGWTLICVACCSSAAAIEAAAAGADAEAAAASSGPDALWHVLPPELQHSLSGVLMRHSESESLDPEVDALLSHLLHDELDSQHQEFIAEEQQASKEAEEMAKAEDEKRRREHERATAHLEEQRRAHEVEREAARVQREAEQKRAQEEALERHRSHEEMLRKNKEFNQQMQERREKSQQKRAALQEQHAKNWQRATSMLQQVHEQIEIVTDGWREAPFWDDFFRTSSASGRFSQLGFDHLQPVLAAAAMQPQHRLLVLEPRGATLAERLAEEIRSRTAQQAEAQQYGSEGEGARDFVIEFGLLDAMSMSNVSQGLEVSKLAALKNAASRMAKLVKPGGTWISISAVPPALHVPLLGRLANGMFALPSESEDAAAGTHAIVLPPAAAAQSKTGLRGAAQVADMLLYGSESVHIWAYRMQRLDDFARDLAESSPSPSAPDAGLLDIIRQQRPATRDDL
mmetsp:Transcript_117653/g.374865  ORF Transcript_117653/g.374865 Transcript_117653/m.374865 type:complete len:458 (-) Transcript_117653:165-1538(-)